MCSYSHYSRLSLEITYGVWEMNVICSTIEAVTATTQLIGTIIGSLSIIWSWASGLLHCAEGTIMNPIISTICGPLVSGLGLNSILEILGSAATSFIGVPLSQALGGVCGGISDAIQSLIPK